MLAPPTTVQPQQLVMYVQRLNTTTTAVAEAIGQSSNGDDTSTVSEIDEPAEAEEDIQEGVSNPTPEEGSTRSDSELGLDINGESRQKQSPFSQLPLLARDVADNSLLDQTLKREANMDIGADRSLETSTTSSIHSLIHRRSCTRSCRSF